MGARQSSIYSCVAFLSDSELFILLVEHLLVEWSILIVRAVGKEKIFDKVDILLHLLNRHPVGRHVCS